MEKCPISYETFFGWVFEHLKEYLSDRLSDDDIIKYMNQEEEKEIIVNRYNSECELFLAGEIDEEVFRIGCASAVASTLYLLNF